MYLISSTAHQAAHIVSQARPSKKHKRN